MIITATQKFVRQTPRKVRLVAASVKKLKLEDAVRQLGVMDRTASTTVLKVVRQALANAMNNHSIKFEELTLKNIYVDEGATYKRFRAVSRGRAHTIMKRSCHITVELEKPDVVVAPIERSAAPAQVVKVEKVEKVAPAMKAEAVKTPAKKAAAKKKETVNK
jgi:large subunit ribosomal protein L22